MRIEDKIEKYLMLNEENITDFIKDNFMKSKEMLESIIRDIKFNIKKDTLNKIDNLSSIVERTFVFFYIIKSVIEYKKYITQSNIDDFIKKKINRAFDIYSEKIGNNITKLKFRVLFDSEFRDLEKMSKKFKEDIKRNKE